MDFWKDRVVKFLKLKRPLVIFSIETTGPSISADKIIAIDYIKIMPNSRVIKGSFILNPEVNISPESKAIHGLEAKDLKNKPIFRQKAGEIWEIFNNCHYGGFNIVNFDLPLLRREFIRTGLGFEYTAADIIDTKAIFNYMEPPTLSVAYNYYCHKDYLGVHKSGLDVQAETEHREQQQGRGETRKPGRRGDVHGGEQDHDADRDVEAQQQVEQHRRQRDDHHRDQADDGDRHGPLRRLAPRGGGELVARHQSGSSPARTERREPDLRESTRARTSATARKNAGGISAPTATAR